MHKRNRINVPNQSINHKGKKKSEKQTHRRNNPTHPLLSRPRQIKRPGAHLSRDRRREQRRERESRKSQRRRRERVNGAWEGAGGRRGRLLLGRLIGRNSEEGR